MDQRPLLALTVCSPKTSNKGSLIFIDSADTDAALRLARKLARETGHLVTVREADMQEIYTVQPPNAH